MGISPECWGPYMWGAIHLICLGAPAEIDQASRSAYVMFFQQLPYILPCSTCATHLLENLKKDPVEPHLSGRESLFMWSVGLHNIVNRQLGKKEMHLEQARKHWESVCNGQNKSAHAGKTGFSVHILFVIGVLIGVGLMYSIPRIRRGLRRN